MRSQDELQATRTAQAPSSQPVALITGASSGIGLASALALAQAGYRVFGTSRKPANVPPKGVTLLVADVTDDASVEMLVADLMSAAGRIINLSSGLGVIPAPYNAHCAGTKHAREGYSESLDQEVRSFGIRVLLIQPGVTRSSIDTSATPAVAPLAAYDGLWSRYDAAFGSAMAAADSSESVAKTILLAARDTTPRLRYPSGKLAKQGVFARRFLPRDFRQGHPQAVRAGLTLPKKRDESLPC